MKVFKSFVALSLVLLVANATELFPKTQAEVLDIAGENMQKHHTYGVFFTDKDEGFMSSVAGLFTEDKEREFKSMLIDTDEVNLMHLNTDNEEFGAMAQAMGITEFPYILVYFNGD